MQYFRKKQRFTWLVSLAVLVLIAACSGPEPKGGDEGSVALANVEVFVFPGEVEKRLISYEDVEQNNCDGSAEMSQTIKREHTVQYILEIGTELTVNAEGNVGIPGIGEVGLGAEVATHYGVGYGRQESLSRSVTVAAAPETNILHTIRQYEVWEIGEILVVAGENSQRLPYSFLRDFSVESVPPANFGCPGSSGNEVNETESVNTEAPTPTSASLVSSTENSPSNEPCPPHGSDQAMFTGLLTAMGTETSSAGTGVFINIVRPFGNLESPYLYVKDALNESCVQLISPGQASESTRQCVTSQYNTNRIWMGSAMPGSSILIQSGQSGYENIGQLDQIAPDARSYLLEYPISVGDEICIEAPSGKTLIDVLNAGGYHLMIGRDLQRFTDSWCVLLENDDTQHWCQ